MTMMKSIVAAAALAVLPMVASAAVVNAPGGIVDITADNSYSFSYSVTPTDDANDGVRFRFNASENLRVTGFSLSGSGNNGGDDITNSFYRISNPNSGQQPFQRIDSLGTQGAGLSLEPGSIYQAGERFNVIFRTTAELPISFTVSFTTAQVPVPAAGLLLLTAVGGAAALRRRKKADKA